MLTTLDRVKAELKGTEALKPAGIDQALMGYIMQVTQRVRKFGYDFEPQYDTEYFTAEPSTINSQRGLLSLINERGQRYLLASSTDTPTILVDGHAKTYGTTVLPDPQGSTPIRTLRLNDANDALCDGWYPRGRQFLDSIAITGWWGWRERYATEGWLSSGQTVLNSGGINETTTFITVTNVGAEDFLFRTPTFSAGNLIRFGDEMALVYKTDAIAESLHVRRGVNGSTAAVQAQGAPISIWEPEEDIVHEVTRQVCLWQARKGAFEQVVTDGVATAVYPRDLLASLYNVLQGFGNR